MGIRPLAVTCALAVALSGLSRPALAAQSGLQAPLGEPDEGEEAEEQPPAPAAPLPVLDTTPRWAAGLEGYAGIGVQWTSGDERAHGFVGGLARIRYGFVQAGATFETTDSGEAAQLSEPLQEHWRAIGGFAGVWLPYRHWADIEASLGLTSRSYVNRNQIYGPSGFDRSNAAVTFRLGVSDRMTERLFGPRVGAALVGGVDLQRYSPAWRREFLLPGGGIGATTGVTDIGGVSIGLVVVLGLELGGGVYRPR
jgi:hypothetical protein